MKKKTLKLVALMLLGVMLVMALASCSSYSKILSNFKAEGYEEIKTEDNDDVKKITAELESGNISCEFHFLKKKLDDDANTADKFANATTMVVILEFSSDKEMLEAIEESNTLTGMIKDAQKSDYVRDNCILIQLLNSEAKEIFNK